MDMKIKRKCSECGKEYKASSGHVCEECWPEFKRTYPEWQEFIKQFPELDTE